MKTYQVIVSENLNDCSIKEFKTWLGAKRNLNKMRKIFGFKNVRLVVK